MVRVVIVFGLIIATVFSAPIKGSKEELTNSLIALKSHSKTETPPRPKRSDEESKATVNNDDISGAALVLAKYIQDTGDLDGVMDFLRSMVSDGKMSEADGMSYIAEVLSSLQTIKLSHNHHEVDPDQKLRHDIQVVNEARDTKDSKDSKHQEKLNKILREEENLKKSKQEIENKIKNLESQKSEEEEKQLIHSLEKQVEEGEKDNETILNINKLLEEEKSKNKISKHLYMHVKEALIQTAVENISKLTTAENN